MQRLTPPVLGSVKACTRLGALLRTPHVSPPVRHVQHASPATHRQPSLSSSSPSLPASSPVLSPASSTSPLLTFPRLPLPPLLLHQLVDFAAQSAAGTGCQVWPLSLRLSSFLSLAFFRLPCPPALLDLSGGCGYLGLSLAPFTSATAICDQPSILPLLRRNVRANRHPSLPRVRVQPLTWDADAAGLRAFVRRLPPLDVVTACDLHYTGVDHRHSSLPSLHRALARLLLALSSLATERSGRVLTTWWAMETRGPFDDESCAPLYRLLAEGGLHVSEPLTASDGWQGERHQNTALYAVHTPVAVQASRP